MNFKQRLQQVQGWAEREQQCRRKSVACFIAIRDPQTWKWDEFVRARNGPSALGDACINVVGNCGCAHAEPRAILAAVNLLNRADDMALVCEYSPCTSCANIIVDSIHEPVELPIRDVYYRILTEHDKRGVEILKAAGLGVHCLT